MFRSILVANRGEIALRIVRAAKDLGVECVALFARDDAALPHVGAAGRSVGLSASGPSAYLDIEQIVRLARESGCDSVHPGYGFLSERADFAQACEDGGLVFIGPEVGQLRLFGDKAASRALAERHGVAVMPGTRDAVTLEQALDFFDAQQGAGVMVKAVGGGGGRGMRAVLAREDLPAAYERCVSEARAAFGVEGVYVERMMRRARHIEIQVLGDGTRVVSLGERECSLQRRFQKLVEIAPSPSLTPSLRRALTDAALRMARAVGYRGLGTFEFLVDAASEELPWVFIEANPRLQVEHTVTEEVTGLDLVQAQIAVAAGRSLEELGLGGEDRVPTAGFAVQCRINAEALGADGQAKPASGRLEVFEMPAGPGIRVDTHGVPGLRLSAHYDTLLAKLVVNTRNGRFEDAARRVRRALAECRVEGVASNLGLLRAIAGRPEFDGQDVHTRFVEEHLPALLARADAEQAPARWPAGAAPDLPEGGRRGDPALQPGQRLVRAPMAARLVQLKVACGDRLPARSEMAVLEAMKMEHLLLAEEACQVVSICASVGDLVEEGEPLLVVEPVEMASEAQQNEQAMDLDAIRADLQAVIDRHAFTLDAHRPEAVARRRAQGSRTARENVASLCDEGSFVEYGALAVAAQSRRRTPEDLIRNTPADGLVAGVGTVNADRFGREHTRCAVMAYDYTVLAGTQGVRNHRKMERLIGVARELRLPVLVFAEGGGGRPGDVDVRASLDNPMFGQFAALSGHVPMVGIAHGRCFAGNAALLGCSDVIIATRQSNIGMSGPAMIESGGLGRFRPEEVGPSDVHGRNGVIDLLVEDEAAAARAARQYLSYFQGTFADWRCADQRRLRVAVPENRVRVYDMQDVLGVLADEGSLLELRAGFGAGVITALARIEGMPVGLMASNPGHLGGAIDADAADKSARFMSLCDTHGLPIVSLMDTPGFMVGPDIEARAQVRHACRMFLVGSHLGVPFFTVVLRKGYGLGAQAMAAGGFSAPLFTVSWPTGEFGPMGIEGAVRLGYRRELDAVAPGHEREALFLQLVQQEYANGTAVNAAQHLEVDAVIDPADTRAWLVQGLLAARTKPRQPGSGFVDAW